MKPIQDVENMQPEAIELFEAAGYMDAQTIFDHRISDITTELIKANNVLEIIDTEPTRAMVAQWLKPLEDKFEKVFGEDDPEIEPNTLIEPKDLLNSPFAVPVSEKFIDEHHVDLSELPSGTVRFLKKEEAIAFSGGYETAPVSYNLVTDQTPRNKKTAASNEPLFSGTDSQELDMSRILKTETFQNEGSAVDPIARNKEINYSRSTRKETNEGVSSQSKFYIKGVLHKNAGKLKSGCRWLILAHLFIFLSFAITPLVLVDKDNYGWAIWAPLLGVIAIVIYLSAAQRASCPICNQKLFAPKVCRKHKRAHHWPFFGYMLPTAVHALLFKWFRCIFCGTSVRLKE